jgi:formyltetrahydrofolate deformylase
MAQSAVLLLACQDQPGIVSRITSHMFSHGRNISRAEQSESVADGRFFLRIHFDHQGREIDMPGLGAELEAVAKGLDADWSLHDPAGPQRIGIPVSKQPFCLLGLLGKWRTGDIRGQIVVVISNHGDAEDIASEFGVPFPILNSTERASYKVDLLVMARYMQNLSDSFIDDWEGRVINIHHPFLPAFPGARPSHQAMDRGVKLIGATAHYATAELDDRPIIEQGVTCTSHRDSVSDFVRRGREVERTVLASAVQAHLEHRIIVDGRRTIVFE